jgi:hypothetical protein
MPATYTAQNRLSRAERRIVDFNPGAIAATLATLEPIGTLKCLPIALFRRFVAGFMHVVGTGTITSFKIIAATAADGTGNTAVVVHPLGTQPDAVGDRLWLECDVDQIREVLPAATHVGVEIAQGTAGDRMAIFFERADGLQNYSGLTSDYTS